MANLVINSGPLQGIRILDLTAVVMGPYATQTLGDLGADVIKVEPPTGDNLRAIGPMRHPGMGPMAMHLNRNKRSIVLDLKNPEGRDACLRLVESCDALIYNTRPQAMARLGLDYAAVAARNPRIVFVGAFGFGEEGPYAGKPAYDDLIQGAAAVSTLLAEQSGGAPSYVPLAFSDRAVGLQAAIALLAAVLHAQRTGHGQAVEVPMFEALTQLVIGDHLGGHSFDPPIGPMGYERLLSSHRKPFATADGFLSVVIYNDKQWHSFLGVIARPDLRTSPIFSSHTARAANTNEVYSFVADVMTTRTCSEWILELERADVPVARLHTKESLLEDPHLNAVAFYPEYDHPSEGRIRTVAPVGRYSATSVGIHRHAPRIGEHSVEILKEAGLDHAKINQMMLSGATVQAGPISAAAPMSNRDEPG